LTLDDGTQELYEPPQEQAEVVAGSGEDGVDAIVGRPFDIVAVHAVLGLDGADEGPTAARRFISRRMEAVTLRTCPEIYRTLNRFG